MNQLSFLARGASALLLALASLAEASAADQLFYRVEGPRIEITNTPSRSDLLPMQRQASPSAGPPVSLLPATTYDPFIDRIAQENGLTPRLIKAVALVESGLDPRAVSPKGAQGLMQLMPATARQYGVKDAFDPHENLRAGAQHLRSLLDEFGDEKLALAAYNAGAGAVRRHKGVPAYRETRDYVRKVQERLGRRSASGNAQPVAMVSDPDIRVMRRDDGTILLAN